MEGNVESILEEYEGLPRVREGFNEIYWEFGLLSRTKKAISIHLKPSLRREARASKIRRKGSRKTSSFSKSRHERHESHHEEKKLKNKKHFTTEIPRKD